MIVLGINGSPRRGGNTDIALEKALEGARSKGASVEKIVLNEIKFAPCQECEEVKDDGTCKVMDGFQMIYQKIREADAVIVASPIFFGSLSAQMKMMVDRFQCHWRVKYITKKKLWGAMRKGAFICIEASSRNDFLENAKSIAKNLFVTANLEYTDELLVTGVDDKGKILDHPDVLKKAYELGKKIVL
ncbi:MAG: flavodoxin family protein [Candidatus Omnitrophota bacterium]